MSHFRHLDKLKILCVGPDSLTTISSSLAIQHAKKLETAESMTGDQHSLPDYLYHYTTIENLGLILKNKNILFSRADLVNDIEELSIEDLPQIKNYVYISCWTNSDQESIPLWNMYSSAMRGVRIRLPSNLFEGEIAKSKYKGIPIHILRGFNTVKTGENESAWIPYLIGPMQVLYKKKPSVSVLKAGSRLSIEKIGSIKNIYWQFEKEFRFIACPQFMWDNNKSIFTVNETLATPKEEFILISLNCSPLNSIEVTLGPFCGEAERIIVEALLKQYAPEGRCRDSQLKAKIRERNQRHHP